MSSESVNPSSDWQGLSSGEEDYRGRYGYGRPAHGSDPSARYGFPEPKLPGAALAPDQGADD